MAILKVTSHIDTTNYSYAEQFVLEGNAWADCWASYALHQLPAPILAQAATARREYQLLQSGTSSVYAHFVRVGLMALQCKKPLQQSHDMQIRCQHEHIAIDTHAFSHWLKWSSPDKLRFRGFDKFISFWTNLSDSAEPPLLYAWHELFIAWQLKTGSIGVSRLKSG